MMSFENKLTLFLMIVAVFAVVIIIIVLVDMFVDKKTKKVVEVVEKEKIVEKIVDRVVVRDKKVNNVVTLTKPDPKPKPVIKVTVGNETLLTINENGVSQPKNQNVNVTVNR